jgi:sulfhydrogenase subunit delta
MVKTINKKPKIAIFDLTDCEGCELEFIALRENLTKTLGQVEIANWRLASDNHDNGPFDLTFIEGSPMTDNDIEVIKQARAVSRVIISLGTCAEFGGIQANFDQKEWEKGVKQVYGDKYKTKNRAPRPVSYYIDVDYHIPGCPINKNQLADVLTSLFIGKNPSSAAYPVCLECKAKENSCLLLEGQACLGPVTSGGCEAVCPERGLRCWGCFGPLVGGNHKAIKNFFESKFGKARTKQLLKTFYSNQNEYKGLYLAAENKPKKEVKIRIT